MSGLPIVKGTGTIVANPELRFTTSGTPVTNVSIAFNERKLVNGEWEDGEATFLRCVIWRSMAENAAESLTKGMRVTVEGELRPNNYDVDGETRYGFELNVSEIAPSLRFATAKVTKQPGSEITPESKAVRKTNRPARSR